MSLPPAKKQKVTQKFREEYSRTWPFIQRSKIGDEYAFCDICTVDIKISSGARYDLERHILTVVKMSLISRGEVCHSQKFSPDFLTKVKKLSQLAIGSSEGRGKTTHTHKDRKDLKCTHNMNSSDNSNVPCG